MAKSKSLGVPCEADIQIPRDSFHAPVTPSQRVYSYGPAIVLKGLSISGEQLVFDRPLSNFIEISAEQVAGSCPYVFSYDDHGNQWVRRGKTIDNASAPERETTGQIRQDGLGTRFMIREEDPEITFVHRVRLELTLSDGHELILMPRNRLRPESADHYDKIKYGAEREYDFVVPANLDATNVVKSTLAVTGYYLPYSTASSIDDQGGK